MPILLNIRQLARGEMQFKGQVPVPELDIETFDEMLQVNDPLSYDLVAQMIGDEILVRGRLRLALDCQCVRCLRSFKHDVVLTGPLLSLALTGEEAVPVINECVDLTPYLREDILLAFPQHPVCGSDCPGVPPGAARGKTIRSGTTEAQKGSAAWAELNKLKL